jgi:hypothetical protein
MIKLINILKEIKVNKPNSFNFFVINTKEDKDFFEDKARKNNWIFYTGDMAYEDVLEIGKEYKVIPYKDNSSSTYKHYIVYPKDETSYTNYHE